MFSFLKSPNAPTDSVSILGEDIISVIMLAFIAIIIVAILYRSTPSYLHMPIFAVIALCFWIIADFILINRHKKIHACMAKDKEFEMNKLLNSRMDDDADDIDDMDDAANDENGEKKNSAQEDANAANAVNSNSNFGSTIMANAVSECSSLTDNYDLYLKGGPPKSGDDTIAERMQYMAVQPKLSQDIRSRYNAGKIAYLYQKELEANETRDWWDAPEYTAHLDKLM